MSWQKAAKYGILAVLLTAGWNWPVFANTYPPTPTQHFYGDADGDTAITVTDLNIITNYLFAQPYTFGTLQPQNPDQDWNTCDTDSDRACTVSDKNVLRNYVNAQTVIISDKPWGLQNVNLPLSGNTANTWIPFNVNLYSNNGGPSGRPGVSVVAEIAPVGSGSTVTGKISGRDCNPMGAGRDQATPDGAQCALAVTQTDWNIAPGTADTESGTYGFGIWSNGSGDLKLTIRIEENALMDIPSVIITQIVSFGKIWYVNVNATGTNNGTSWADAFKRIQDAADAASYGDQVWVAQGTYKRPSTVSGYGIPAGYADIYEPALTTSTNEPVLEMTDGVEFYGGFVGNESVLPQRGDPLAHPSTLDGENLSLHVVIGAGYSRLDGFIITNGRATKFPYACIQAGDCTGGGMYVSLVYNLTIVNCKFINNFATHYGGGIWSYTSSMVIERCLFQGNSAIEGALFHSMGGAIAHYDEAFSSCLVRNSVFLNNFSNLGGAICAGSVIGPPISIKNCSFNGNSAWKSGGAIPGGDGGGAYGDAIIINSILWGDTAQNQGNEVYGDITATYSDIQGGYSGVGNIDANPFYVSASNLRLQSGSPCIDTGTATGAPADDLDGYPRPYPALGAFDMGAYEWHP